MPDKKALKNIWQYASIAHMVSTEYPAKAVSGTQGNNINAPELADKHLFYFGLLEIYETRETGIIQKIDIEPRLNKVLSQHKIFLIFRADALWYCCAYILRR